MDELTNRPYRLDPTEVPYDPNDSTLYLVLEPCFVTTPTNSDTGAVYLHEDNRDPLAIPSSYYLDRPHTVARRLFFYLTGRDPNSNSRQFARVVTTEMDAVMAALGGCRRIVVMFAVKYITLEAVMLWESYFEGWPPSRTPPAAECVIRDLEEVEVLVVDDSICCVCRIELTPLLILFDQDGYRDLILVRLLCSHIFHKTCIVRWLRIKGECPLCRYVLPSERDLGNTL